MTPLAAVGKGQGPIATAAHGVAIDLLLRTQCYKEKHLGSRQGHRAATLRVLGYKTVGGPNVWTARPDHRRL